MNVIKLSTFLFLFIMSSSVIAQDVVGTWLTRDEKTNEPTSHIVIEATENGSLRGYVSKGLRDDGQKTCTKCKGDKKNKPIVGLEIIWGFKKGSNGEWVDGSILDPRNGKVYNCKLKIDNNGNLNIRGYWKFTWLGKTQTWYPVTE